MNSTVRAPSVWEKNKISKIPVTGVPYRFFLIAAALILAAFSGCQVAEPSSPVNASPPEGNDADPVILADIYNTSSVYDPDIDSTIRDTCLEIHLACIGSPMPVVQQIFIDGKELQLRPYFNDQLGFVQTYAFSNDIYKPFIIKVVTSRGTASASCGIPPVPPYIISPPYGVQLQRGVDQTFEIVGNADFYRCLFTFGHYSNGYTRTDALLDTIVSSVPFILRGSFTADLQATTLEVAIKGYNGSLPFQKGATANMEGNAYGFAYAHNEFNESWNSRAEYSFPDLQQP